MKEETRRLALRAAHALVGLAACSSPPPNAAKTVDVAPATAAPLDSSLPPGPPRDCKAITDQEFTGPDHYRPEVVPKASNAAKQCCRDALTAGYSNDVNSVYVKHRWTCCAVVDPNNTDGLACTPWGPPVPPRMNARLNGRRPARLRP